MDLAGRQHALWAVMAPEAAPEQPPVLDADRAVMSAAIGSLALGGAERIVLDWAARSAAQHRVRLFVLHDAPAEWPVPPGVEITRLGGTDLVDRLEAAGVEIASYGNPVVLCHLLSAEERRALQRGGAQPVPVLHNAAAGWLEHGRALSDSRLVIAVSDSAARELGDAGVRAPCAVIRHVPRTPRFRSDARRAWRRRWDVPEDALVIGMIGAVKPQKAYPRALRVLAALAQRRDAWLVILGGPIGRDGGLAWRAVLAQAWRLGVEPRVRLPGFVANAADALCAFDLVLNTSRYEGLSIATLEALAAGLPVVASDVGGQAEMPSAGLTLLPFAASDARWADAVEAALGTRPAPPAWRDFPAHRVWTLFHLLQPFEPGRATLFVTANLNAGGAQRSLCNLTLALNGSLPFEIAVCGNSSTGSFSSALDEAGVRVRRSATTRDCFDHAEALVRMIVAGKFGTICFWNVDAKVKLLLAKVLAATTVRLIDVSPGGYSFEEMRATRAFQQWIAYSEREYYARLDHLVSKYCVPDGRDGRRKVTVIPNGVPDPNRLRRHASADADAPPRIVVNGRIAPSKFLIEVIAAMRLLWRGCPRAELHVLGTAEAGHDGYARTMLAAIGAELDSRVFLHGPSFDSPERLASYTVALVLGEHQGCPNAVLEALAAGVPVVANDSGGTSELVIDARTGLLLRGCDPHEIAAALERIVGDVALARRLGEAGRRHVLDRYSMKRMVTAYRGLLAPPGRG